MQFELNLKSIYVMELLLERPPELLGLKFYFLLLGFVVNSEE